MRVQHTIRRKLELAFQPQRLDIEDHSSRHAGHAHAPVGGESHFNITLVSDQFAGLSRLDRQRRVHTVLRDELDGPVHALSLILLTPQEDKG